jgi:hypothetical protein
MLTTAVLSGQGGASGYIEKLLGVHDSSEALEVLLLCNQYFVFMDKQSMPVAMYGNFGTYCSYYETCLAGLPKCGFRRKSQPAF